MMEHDEGAKINSGESREKLNRGELFLTEEVYTRLVQETIARTGPMSEEFQAFLLGKDGMASVVVLVGEGNSDRVIVTPEHLVYKLRPYIDSGLEVVADYHNHPEATVEVYTAANFPPEHAVTPSSGDLIQLIPQIVQRELHQGQYPRIIGAYIASQQRVVMGGFLVERNLTHEEDISIRFPDPSFIADEPDELGIKFGASEYTDTQKLKDLGVIKGITLSVVRNNSNESIFNPLA